MMDNPKRPAVTPSPLAVHGDQLLFNIKAEVPAGALSPRARYTLTPYFEYADKKVQLKSIEFLDSRQAQTVSEVYSLDYTKGMEDGTLEVYGSFTDLKSGERAAYRLPLYKNTGVLTTSQLIEENYKPIYSNLEPFYIEMDTLRFDFQFGLGQSDLLNSAFNERLLRQLDSVITSDVVILRSKVIGTHSPVGSDAINRVLSEKRAHAVKTIYDEKIVNHVTTDLDRVDLNLEVEFNSWSIFIEKLKNTRLWQRDKKVISEITSQGYSYDQIKTRLLALPDIGAISREVFPLLQMSRLEIANGRTIHNPEQLIEVVEQILNENRSQVDHQGILAVTQMVDNHSKKLELYGKAALLQESVELHNDWAITLLARNQELPQNSRDKGYLEEIYHRLQRSLAMNPETPAAVNLGIVNSTAGRLSLATKYFDLALSLKDDSWPAYNDGYYSSRGITEMKMGLYNEAVKSFEQVTDKHEVKYNLGLSQLLAGDNNRSLTNLMEADSHADSSEVFYAMAIASNRKGDTNGALNYLSRSFEGNARYNDFFHEDHEFKAINKVLFPRYPDSLKRAVPGFKTSGSYQLPPFIFPLPAPSAQFELKDDQFKSGKTLGELAKQLTSGLNELGWSHRDYVYFLLPDARGFIILNRMEQVDASGLSMFPPERWLPRVKFKNATEPEDIMGNYIAALKLSDNGTFRLPVFVVSIDDDIVASQPGLGQVIEAGYYELPESVKEKRYNEHTVRLLFYEFKKGSDGIELISDSLIDHYVTSGFKRAIEGGAGGSH